MQLKNEIKSEKKKIRFVMSVMQVCATQAGQASEPKRQELKISRTEIYLKSINGWLSVARKKVFRFFTGCRACIFKTHHRIQALKQVKRPAEKNKHVYLFPPCSSMLWKFSLKSSE